MSNNNLTLEETKQRINSFKDRQSIPIKKTPYLNSMIRKIANHTHTGRVAELLLDEKDNTVWWAKIKVQGKKTLAKIKLDEIELDPVHNR